MDAENLTELYEFLRIPSVSADPARSKDVLVAADWVANFITSGGGAAEVVDVGGAPIVVGEFRASRAHAYAADVMAYGHFDVQPPDPLELWLTDPFGPEIRDGWLYSRGVADDKGQLWMQLTAAANLTRTNELPVNLRFVCDGQEEVGGNAICDWIAEDTRGAVACVVFDGGMLAPGFPVLNVGLRGLCYFHVRCRTGERDLHSGLFGGAALNAIHALNRCLKAVLPEDGSLPSALCEGALPPSPLELASWSELESGDRVLADQGAVAADAAAEGDFYVRTWAEPSVDVNGIMAGSPILQKTVLPASAEANLSIRIAPGQSAPQVAETFEQLLRAGAPAGAQIDVQLLSIAEPALFDVESEPLQIAADVLQSTVGRRPPFVRSGGSLPLAAALARRGIVFIGTGFDLPDGNVHSPNERLLVDYLDVGVTSAERLYAALGQLDHRPIALATEQGGENGA